MTDYYQTEKEIAAVVEGFESCTTSKEAFTHISHLTVATYYLSNSTPDESFKKMRSALLRFLDHHGVDNRKYSDLVTQAWLEQIQGVSALMPRDSSLIEIVNTVIARLGSFRLPKNENTEGHY